MLIDAHTRACHVHTHTVIPNEQKHTILSTYAHLLTYTHIHSTYTVIPKEQKYIKLSTHMLTNSLSHTHTQNVHIHPKRTEKHNIINTHTHKLTYAHTRRTRTSSFPKYRKTQYYQHTYPQTHIQTHTQHVHIHLKRTEKHNIINPHAHKLTYVRTCRTRTSSFQKNRDTRAWWTASRVSTRNKASFHSGAEMWPTW